MLYCMPTYLVFTNYTDILFYCYENKLSEKHWRSKTFNIVKILQWLFHTSSRFIFFVLINKIILFFIIFCGIFTIFTILNVCMYVCTYECIYCAVATSEIKQNAETELGFYFKAWPYRFSTSGHVPYITQKKIYKQTISTVRLSLFFNLL